jgi:hypothetical protein
MWITFLLGAIAIPAATRYRQRRPVAVDNQSGVHGAGGLNLEIRGQRH